MDSRQHGALSRTRARISHKAGGAFSAWGGHLTGYNLALRPGRKIVQAWRATGWWPDHYSIAVFDIQKLGKGTRLRFTQIGIPPHRYSGHYRGWIETYLTPMKEILEKGELTSQTRSRLTADHARIRTGRFRRKLSKRN
jgi:activator of HSP90 ATPase